MILGIETSCDDTSAAVLTAAGEVLSSVVSSQTSVHAPYGGVVPELASRHHLENLPGVVGRALEEAGIGLGQVRAVAATAGPGLLGSILVGLSYAKSMALALRLPFRAVNHIEAHLTSPWIENPGIPLPSLALVVSGGHSHLFIHLGNGDDLLVAATRDDAAGEALDKVAKRLRLPYPGGPFIDRVSGLGNPKAVEFPLPRMSGDTLDFSFSGLKTALLYHIRDRGLEPAPWSEDGQLPQWEYDVLASFQRRVVDHLLQRTRKALLAHRPASLVMAGGVACNRLLRSRLAALAAEFGIPGAFPSPRFCTDNAAMVAFNALPHVLSDSCSPLDCDAYPSVLWRSARKQGPGPRKHH